MILVAGLLYVALFLYCGWRWPQIPLLLIFALAPFQYDISTGGPVRFSIAEINLLLTVPLLVATGRPILLGPTALPTALYLGVCLTDTLIHWRDSSLVSLVQMGIYLVAAVVVFTSFVKRPEEFRLALRGLVVVGAVLALAVVVTRSGYVLGLHKNGVGSSLAVAVVVAAELWFSATSRREKRWLGIGTLIIAAGLFFTLSRGAWIGAVCALLMLLGLRRKFRLLMQVSIGAVVLIAVGWYFLPSESREYATSLDRKNENIRLRFQSIDFARELFESSPVVGVGVGLRKEYDATNIIWLTLAETGVPGLLTWLLIHLALTRMVWRDHQRVAQSDILFSLSSLGGALVVSILVHGLVDHYWSRGAIMVAWCSAGMATHAHFIVRGRMAFWARERWRRAQEAAAGTLQPSVSHG